MTYSSQTEPPPHFRLTSLAQSYRHSLNSLINLSVAERSYWHGRVATLQFPILNLTLPAHTPISPTLLSKARS